MCSNTPQSAKGSHMKKITVLLALLSSTSIWAAEPAASTPGLMDMAKSAATKANETALINLNTASESDISKVPGISPEMAKEIIAKRPYQSVTDLKKVKGLKEDVIAKIKPFVAFK